MNKKNYFAPCIQEMRLAMTAVICDTSPVINASSNVGIKGAGKDGALTGGDGTGGTSPRSNDRGNDAEWGNLW